MLHIKNETDVKAQSKKMHNINVIIVILLYSGKYPNYIGTFIILSIRSKSTYINSGGGRHSTYQFRLDNASIDCYVFVHEQMNTNLGIPFLTHFFTALC